MSHSFLAFRVDGQKRITVWTVIKTDLIPWLLGIGLALLLYSGVYALLTSVRPDMDGRDIGAILFTTGQYFLWALILLAVMAARRSTKDVWTWALAAVLILFFLPQPHVTLAVTLMPNSLLNPLMAMLGFLAAGRVIEYIRMRYALGIKEPRLSIVAMSLYVVVMLVSVVFCSNLVYEQIRVFL